MKFLLLTTIATLLAYMPNQAEAGDSLHDAIQDREDEWSAAYNANDADRLGAIYEEDAVLIPPGSGPVNGRAAIAQTLQSLFPQLKNMKLVADDVRPLGANHAVEVGHSEYSAVAEDGSMTPGIDNYVVVWHKGDDGVWRYVTDIFNAR